jgi:mannose-6-phosphate isomerase-like protein (cupin superfamily)
MLIGSFRKQEEAVSSGTQYSMNMNIRFQGMEVVDLPNLIADCKDKWYNQTLCRVNDSVVRLGILEGEFHWHKHANEDEFFYVVEGSLMVDFEGHTVELKERQGMTVPRGIVHRTRAPGKTVVLMIEGAGVVPTGD